MILTTNKVVCFFETHNSPLCDSCFRLSCLYTELREVLLGLQKRLCSRYILPRGKRLIRTLYLNFLDNIASWAMMSTATCPSGDPPSFTIGTLPITTVPVDCLLVRSVDFGSTYVISHYVTEPCLSQIIKILPHEFTLLDPSLKTWDCQIIPFIKRVTPQTLLR